SSDLCSSDFYYDVERDFYQDYKQLFVEHYKSENPNSNILIKQSHGSSSKQALSVASGLQADVATMNQGSDIELLEEKGLVEADWESKFPDNAVPFTSTIVFLEIGRASCRERVMKSV